MTRQQSSVSPPDDARTLHCTECRGALPFTLLNAGTPGFCPTCWTPVHAVAFPALYRPQEIGRQADRLLIDTDASCFYHIEKKAVSACDACGRFLCALCEIQLKDRRLCPACIQAGRQKDKLTNLSKERTLYDEMALALALLPILLFFLTIVTAPAALYVAIRYWNAPSSIVKRTRIRFIVAIALAALQIAVWIVCFSYWDRLKL